MDKWDHAAPPSRPPEQAAGALRLLDSVILRGCNIHHASTVIRQHVDLGNLAGMRSGQLGQTFGERFLDSFQALRQEVPGGDFSTEFVRRLAEPFGVDIEEVLLEAIIAIEASMAFEMGRLDATFFSTVEVTDQRREVSLIWSCISPRVSRAAAEIALAGVVSLLPSNLCSTPALDTEALDKAFATLQRTARRRRPTPTAAALAMAARKAGMPCEIEGGSHLRLGQGAFQYHILAAASAKTSPWVSNIANDKQDAQRRLAEIGLPTRFQIKVDTAEDARGAAERFGYPVMVTIPGERNTDDTTLIASSMDGVTSAFTKAQEAGSGALVESLIEGNRFVLLVVGNRFTAAARLMPPIVEGDGESTIEQLIEKLNRDPFRDNFRMTKVKTDQRLTTHLQSLGRSLQDVLPTGNVVALRDAATISSGGVAVDVTDQVHSDNKEMAVRAAKMFELDLVSIEFSTADVAKSYKSGVGTITNMNPLPDLRCHFWPRYGNPRSVADTILKNSLRSESDGRVPILLVAGDRGTGRVAREIDAMLRGSGKSVGLVTRDMAFLDGEPLAIESSNRRRALRALLADPRVGSLVGSVSLRQIVRRGLQLDGCNVAAITNRAVDGDADLFRMGIEVLTRAVSGKFVVGVDNTVALDVLRDLDRRRLILVSPRLRGAVIEQHLASGGSAIINLWNEEQDQIALFENDKIVLSLPAEKGEVRPGRTRRRSVETKMFAFALAYGIGMEASEIEQAIKEAPPKAVMPSTATVSAAGN